MTGNPGSRQVVHTQEGSAEGRRGPLPAVSGQVCQRHGPEMATPGGPCIDVPTTLATSWKPAVLLYIQMAPSSAASHTLSPSLTERGERFPATPAAPTR